MALTFVDKLLKEYPIPKDVTIWLSNNLQLTAIESLDELIETAVDELSSDILVTDYLNASGIVTHMPEDTITVQSAMLSSGFQFQGNRLVKVTYDRGKKLAYLRYYPATLTYKRKLRVSDLDNLIGDQLIYAKSYILWKMAEKELQILKAVNMEVDNGVVDWGVLDNFRNTMFSRYTDLKNDILMYASVW